MLTWFDLILRTSVTVITVPGLTQECPAVENLIKKRTGLHQLPPNHPPRRVFHHFVKREKKKKTYHILLNRVTGSWTGKRLFPNTFFPCFSIPMGPCYHSRPPETPWLQPPSYWADFQAKSPCCCACLPELPACLSGGSRAEFISHILDALLSRHPPSFPSSPHSPPSLPSPLIPKSYSHDRNKLARGTGHTLESSKRSVGNQ